MTTERIAEIREEIEEYKEDRSKAKGRIEDIEKRWENEFEVKDLSAAETLQLKLEKEDKKLAEKEKNIEDEIEDLLEEMED